jgi:hypothetical protein
LDMLWGRTNSIESRYSMSAADTLEVYSINYCSSRLNQLEVLSDEDLADIRKNAAKEIKPKPTEQADETTESLTQEEIGKQFLKSIEENQTKQEPKPLSQEDIGKQFLKSVGEIQNDKNSEEVEAQPSQIQEPVVETPIIPPTEVLSKPIEENQETPFQTLPGENNSTETNKALSDFNYWLEEKQKSPTAEIETLAPEIVVQSVRKNETYKPGLEPYSGEIREGEGINYRGEKWTLLRYDGKSGKAIIERISGATNNVQAISQEELYKQNQDREAKQPVQAQIETTPTTAGSNPDATLTLDEIEAKNKIDQTTGNAPDATARNAQRVERVVVDATEKPRGWAKIGETETLEEYKKRLNLMVDDGHMFDTALYKQAEKIVKKRGKGKTERLETETKSRFVETYDKAKEKGSGVWNSIKNKVKLVGGFGLWQIKKTEVVGLGTEDMPQKLSKLSSKIVEEEGLSLNEAQEEAGALTTELGKTPTVEEYKEMSDMITEIKKEQNEKKEIEILKYAEDNLRKRLKENPLNNDPSSQNTDNIIDKNIANFLIELKAELKKMRNGQTRVDRRTYAKLLHKNFDPKWWKKYVYSPLQKVASFMDQAWMVEKLSAGKNEMISKR